MSFEVGVRLSERVVDLGLDDKAVLLDTGDAGEIFNRRRGGGDCKDIMQLVVLRKVNWE